MPTLRIERVPIEKYYLGFFGFDHLQLVYEQDRSPANQSVWYVLEGTVDDGPSGSILGVLGTDGQTTLSQANGDARDLDLVHKIGTPETRGSVIIPVTNGVTAAWNTMASFGASIDEQMLPYIGYGLPDYVTPTINSTSVVASLLFYAGIDINNHLPIGLGRSPGATTLIGTSNDDEMQIVNGFNALVGGDGKDKFEGGADAALVERFIGGKGNDNIKWSNGVNYVHGGQPRLDYAADGYDDISYNGVGVVTINMNPYAIPHVAPDFIGIHEGGVEYLFSIEGINFNEGSDTILLGEGVSLLLDDLILKLDKQDSDGKGDNVSFAPADSGLLINAAGGDNYFVQDAENASGSTKGLWLESAEWIAGSLLNDKIYGGTGIRGLEGNAGDDILDARGSTPFTRTQDGYDVAMFGGDGNDTIVSGTGISIASGGAGADRFILSTLSETGTTVEFVIADADSSDRLFAPHEFFTETYAGFDGSTLLPILGGFMQHPGEDSFADLPENLGPFAGGSDGRSDYAFFKWQTQDQNWNSGDQTHGVFEFVGNILFNRDGGDLLIHVFFGYPREVNSPGYADQTYTHIINTFDTASEAIIRVKNFDEGDLGIHFYDLGEPIDIDLPVQGARPIGGRDYPGWDDGVAAMTNNGILTAALELRPQAPEFDPDKNQQGDPPQFFSGGSGDDVIRISIGSADVDSGAGDDSIETSSGNDHLNGGSGADSMTGGAGNDRYNVDSTGDTIVEAAGGGIDFVTASVSFVLAANVERLQLTGAALTGMGNSQDNGLYGNDLDNALAGLNGKDVLSGGLGNDRLNGGGGSDTYVYQAGDGNDIIIDAGSADDTDLLVLINIKVRDVSFHTPSATPNDFVLTFSGGGRIVLEGFSSGNGHSIDRVKFDDGTVWTRAQLNQFAADAAMIDNDAPRAADDLDFGVRSGTTLISAAALMANDTDYNGDALTITRLSNISAGIDLALDSSGNIVITTPNAYEGVVGFSYTVSDGLAESTANVELFVIKNSAPVAAGTLAAQTAQSGQSFNFALPSGLFTDADGDELILSASLNGGADLPSWLTFDPATGTFTGTPPAGQGGDLDIVIEASDGAATASLGFGLTVETATVTGNIITGTNRNDVLVGTAAADIITGLAGNDLMRGLGGDDVFVIDGTQTGYDTFIGGAGLDRITGGAGNDVIGLAKAANNLVGVEIIDGGAGFDVLRLGPNNNFLNLSKVQVIGVELISAGAGNDRLIGSRGDDHIRGGVGNDHFIFRGSFGQDAITDFAIGSPRHQIQDVIDLRGSGLANFAAVMAHASAAGDGTLIALNEHDSILLEGVRIGQLKANDFLL